MKKITGKFPHFSCFFPPFLQVKSPRPSLCTSRCLWTSLQDKTASTNCLSQRTWLGSNPGKICLLHFSFQKFFIDVRNPDSDSDPIGLSSIIPSLSSRCFFPLPVFPSAPSPSSPPPLVETLLYGTLHLNTSQPLRMSNQLRQRKSTKRSWIYNKYSRFPLSSPIWKWESVTSTPPAVSMCSSYSSALGLKGQRLKGSSAPKRKYVISSLLFLWSVILTLYFPGYVI